MADVSAIILAGGQSRRLGFDKTALRIDGKSLLQRTAELLAAICGGEILVVMATPGQHELAGAGTRAVVDLYPGKGVLGAIYTGLQQCGSAYGLVVGADMPFLNGDLLRYLLSLREGHDVVIPMLDGYPEPLHAVYRRACLAPMERQLQGSGAPRIISFFPDVAVRQAPEHELRPYDADLLSFFNINAPADLERARELCRQRGMSLERL